MPVPSAHVTIAGPDRSIQTADTEDSGVARFPAVAPGSHQLTVVAVVAKGFDDLTTTINAASAGETGIDATLSPIHSESITVQGVIETPLEEANTQRSSSASKSRIFPTIRAP
jgi:hypothetical protein